MLLHYVVLTYLSRCGDDHEGGQDVKTPDNGRLRRELLKFHAVVAAAAVAAVVVVVSDVCRRRSRWPPLSELRYT